MLPRCARACAARLKSRTLPASPLRLESFSAADYSRKACLQHLLFFLHVAKMTDKIALILSGSGVYDGTEVHEASAACVAISRAGKEVIFYAPEVSQHHVVDHASGNTEEGSMRNVRYVFANHWIFSLARA